MALRFILTNVAVVHDQAVHDELVTLSSTLTWTYWSLDVHLTCHVRLLAWVESMPLVPLPGDTGRASRNTTLTSRSSNQDESTLWVLSCALLCESANTPPEDRRETEGILEELARQPVEVVTSNDAWVPGERVDGPNVDGKGRPT